MGCRGKTGCWGAAGIRVTRFANNPSAAPSGPNRDAGAGAEQYVQDGRPTADADGHCMIAMLGLVFRGSQPRGGAGGITPWGGRLSRPCLSAPWRGAEVDHAFEQRRQALPGLAGAAGQLVHLGEAQLGVGEGEPPLRLLGGRRQRVRLLLLLDLDPAAFQQLEFPVERPESDFEPGEDLFAGPGAFRQEHDQAVEPRGASERDMHGGTAPIRRGAFHSRDPKVSPAARGHARGVAPDGSVGPPDLPVRSVRKRLRTEKGAVTPVAGYSGRDDF